MTQKKAGFLSSCRSNVRLLLSGLVVSLVMLCQATSAHAQRATLVRTIPVGKNTSFVGFGGNKTLIGSKVDKDKETAFSWSIATGKRTRDIVRIPPNKKAPVFRANLTGASADGRLLLRHTLGMVEVISTASKKTVFQHAWQKETMARISPDGQKLAVTLAYPESPDYIEVWKIQPKKLLYKLPKQEEVGFTCNGKYLWSKTYSDDDQTPCEVTLRHATTGKVVGRPFRLDSFSAIPAFSPNGSVLAIQETVEKSSFFSSDVRYERQLSLWDVKSHQRLWKKKVEHNMGVTEIIAVEFSPDNKTLLAAQRLWDWRKGQVVQMHKEFGTFSPDGKYLVAECADEKIRVYSVK